ncbi:MAG: hypothetical protein ACYC1S_11345 [Gemmatimonadaceae bacterium]
MLISRTLFVGIALILSATGAAAQRVTAGLGHALPGDALGRRGNSGLGASIASEWTIAPAVGVRAGLGFARLGGSPAAQGTSLPAVEVYTISAALVARPFSRGTGPYILAGPSLHGTNSYTKYALGLTAGAGVDFIAWHVPLFAEVAQVRYNEGASNRRNLLLTSMVGIRLR